MDGFFVLNFLADRIQEDVSRATSNVLESVYELLDYIAIVV